MMVKGFVTKLEECMGACDCIITKVSLLIAVIKLLPPVYFRKQIVKREDDIRLTSKYFSIHYFFLILWSFQEDGNVPHVIENGCGEFSKSPKEMAKIVGEWFGLRQDELKVMSLNASRQAKPNVVFKIVHDMHEPLRQRSCVSPA
ncbi:hypothetical protein MTR67_035596 [Solanum verrucosum]|uniref:Uncharacterized protein n=1 Tax=Solanum verrucosum TaxID=315347 RepID=A0AAF0ZK12_SOLVR|nr:hypothetical protein MTR67_035596 [Solanum verrucosum]